MTPAHESISDRDAERLLASLEGVVSAHVVADARGRIVEIHILSAAGLHPKQVVRNVESALSAGLGMEIDRRIVSVAQIRTSESEPSNGADLAADRGVHHDAGDRNGTGSRGTGSPGPDSRAGAGGPVNGAADAAPLRNGDAATQPTTHTSSRFAGEQPRLEYVRFESRRDAETCACEVILRDGEREIIGAGGGADTAAGRAEAAARAVLDAVEKARSGIRLQLDGAVISTSRGRSYVIVSAQALLQRMTVPLAGAASLARSPEEAGILAALQATNRWSG